MGDLENHMVMNNFEEVVGFYVELHDIIDVDGNELEELTLYVDVNESMDLAVETFLFETYENALKCNYTIVGECLNYTRV